LSIYFTSQSILHCSTNWPAQYPKSPKFWRAATDKTVLRLCCLYALIYSLGITLLSVPSIAQSWGFGLIFPGAGFLVGSDHGLYMLVSLGLFGIGLCLWFATGNVVAAPIVWMTAMIAAGLITSPSDGATELEQLIVLGLPILGIASLWATSFVLWRIKRRRFKGFNHFLLNESSDHGLIKLHPRSVCGPELSEDQLASQRFLLDRALQPIESFDGFEIRDHFQTAALRYQINFLSYALALTQSEYLPALSGYMNDAQNRLKAKQEDPRNWTYWALESLWGNLEHNPDPVKTDNIMYSGFVGTQMMMGLAASPGHTADYLGDLSGAHKRTRFSYRTPELIDGLARQYQTAKFGLLPCEPNWVYPLCNFITAAAIQAFDSQTGSHYWSEIEAEFLRRMDDEFLASDGHFVPFRSSYAGLAAPQIGGLIMQTFPCFFLNSFAPNIALRQWLIMRRGLADKSVKSQCWPIDVGNYNLSRASAYAASAAAAAEMGDTDLKGRLLHHMKEDCSLMTRNGRRFYAKASLWANANAVIAETIRPNGFRQLINAPTPKTGPFIETADPKLLLFTSARQQDDALVFKARPENGPGYKEICIAGLTPQARYRFSYPGGETDFSSSHDGRQSLNLPLFKPSRFLVRPQT